MVNCNKKKNNEIKKTKKFEVVQIHIFIFCYEDDQMTCAEVCFSLSSLAFFVFSAKPVEQPPKKMILLSCRIHGGL